MTYRQISEIVLRQLAGGDITQDFQIKQEEIYIRISQIIPFLIRKDYYESYQINPNKEIDVSVYSTFTACVFSLSNEKYVHLPCQPFMIDGRGAPQVSYIEDRATPISYIDSTLYRMYLNNGVLNEVGAIAFYEYDDYDKEHRLFLHGISDDTKKVKIRMILNCEVDDIDSDIPLQAHLIDELLQRLYQWYNVQDKETVDSVINNKNDKL